MLRNDSTFRPNRRNMSILRRNDGMDAGDRMRERAYKTRASRLILASQLTQDVTIKNNILLAAVACRKNMKDMRKMNVRSSQQKPRKKKDFQINFDTLNEDQYDSLIGFSREESILLFQVMNIPEYFILNEEGSTHEFRVSESYCFLYFLSRYHSPSQRQLLDINKCPYMPPSVTNWSLFQLCSTLYL